ncbi:MAG: T9SS type A sorting domain-containing protein [Bacteroidia bacterium]
MKKISLFLFIIQSFFIQAQPGPFYKSYTLSNSSGNVSPYSKAYGDRVYTFYADYYAGYNQNLTIQKNDQQGNPLTINSINMVLSQSYIQAEAYNGSLYVTGLRGGVFGNPYSNPYLAKIDTNNCLPIYVKEYQINNSNHWISDIKILNDGTILLVGWFFNNNIACSLIMGVDPVNGAPIYTHTLSLGYSTYIGNITEISNSTLLFTGWANNNNQAFIGKATKTTTTFSINSIYNTSAPLGDFGLTSNPKKIISSTLSEIYKVDTNLTFLNSTNGISVNASSSAFYNNNKIYRPVDPDKIEIYDTTLMNPVVYSYPQTASNFSPGVSVQLGSRGEMTFDSSFAYITAWADITQKYFLMKIKLDGSQSCGIPGSGSVFPTPPLTASQTSFTFGTMSSYTINNLIPLQMTNTVIVTPDICAVNIHQNNSGETIKIQSGYGSYTFSGQEYFSKAELYDVTGKLTAFKELDVPSNQLEIEVQTIPKGIYIVKLTSLEGVQYKLKLVNY